jgi:hypothetical protein
MKQTFQHMGSAFNGENCSGRLHATPIEGARIASLFLTIMIRSWFTGLRLPSRKE